MTIKLLQGKQMEQPNKEGGNLADNNTMESITTGGGI